MGLSSVTIKPCRVDSGIARQAHMLFLGPGVCERLHTKAKSLVGAVGVGGSKLKALQG